MLARVVLVLALGGAVVGCSSVVVPPEPAPDPPPPPPPNPVPLGLMELVPASASGAALVHVSRLRAQANGPALTNLVRRLGIFEWEVALELDLRRDVKQLLLFGVVEGDQEPSDLSQVVEAMRRSELGAVVELRPEAYLGDGQCTDLVLAEAEARPLEGAAEGMIASRCGRFVLVRPASLEVTMEPRQPSALAGALDDAVVEGELVAPWVFLATSGQEMIDRASCGEVTVPLAGWQRATVEVADGMTLRGRYHAADTERLDELERCVDDGMGGFGDVPLFSDLQLRDLLGEAEVARDEAEPSDVLLEAAFSARELELMLGLLELVGAGLR